MLSAHSQISLVLKKKEVDHGLSFYAALGSSQTPREFPSVENLGQGTDPEPSIALAIRGCRHSDPGRLVGAPRLCCSAGPTACSVMEWGRGYSNAPQQDRLYKEGIFHTSP